MVGIHLNTKAHLQHLGFTGSQAGQYLPGRIAQTLEGSIVHGHLDILILDKVA